MKKKDSQEAIAAKIGLSSSWASLVINGHKNASLSLAKKLSNLTDTSPLIWMDTAYKAERQRAFLEVRLAEQGDAA